MTVIGMPNPEVASELWQEVQNFLSEHPEIVQRLKDKKIADAVSMQKPPKKKQYIATAESSHLDKVA